MAEKQMIPEAKQAAVTQALQTVFGVNEYEDIHPLTGGLSSALAFKIMVKGRPYLLKILRTEIISDPAKEFACMQAGADAGIAPHIWYSSVEERLLITDFVEAKPFPDDMAIRIAPILRRLHSLSGFSKMMNNMNYLDAMDGFVRRFQASNLLPESATREVFTRYAELVKIYPRSDAELVASHNDVKPQNMRFDGEHIWLVDWESAFLNDEYVDLAMVANFFVKDETHEAAFLAAYFGAPASEYQRARFYLMRQILSSFYFALLFSEVARTGAVIDASTPTPDFKDYHQALVADTIDMTQTDSKVQYALLHLRELLGNMRTPRFDEALSIVAKFHASV